MMDKRGGQRGGHGDPATVNEDHECNGCGGCGKTQVILYIDQIIKPNHFC